jgi:putative transcription factor
LQQICEICGATLHSSGNRIKIDGAVMQVCNNCAKLGSLVKEGEAYAAQTSTFQASLRSASQNLIESNYELDQDYHLKIKQMREKMGLSHEDLGKLINEKPSVIRLVETRKLKPDIILTRKLMHYLKINLLVPLSDLKS